MRALLVVVGLCAFASFAAAQETGGHMGGGDWGGGGGGGTSYSGGSHTGGGGSSPSWSSNSGWNTPSIPTYTPPSIPEYKPRDYGYTPSPTSSSSGSGSYVPDYTYTPPPSHTSFLDVVVPLFIAVVFMIIIGSWIKEFFNIGGLKVPIMSAGYAEEADVTVLRVAIDGRARRFIQNALRWIAQTSNTSTKAGRAEMLGKVSLLLRNSRDAWVYGGACNERMGPLSNIKAIYDRHVDDARTRFSRETITNVDGKKSSQAAGDISRRSDEGEGLILVTIVIAARSELFTVERIGTGEDLRNAIESAAFLGDQLVAVDVIWMPSEDDDRMSSMELEARYPAPDLIPIQGALVGKTFCDHCAGPHPAELVSCPHCGAPARDRAA